MSVRKIAIFAIPVVFLTILWFAAEPQPGAAAIGGGGTPPAATEMRMNFPVSEGVLLVYDALRPDDNPRPNAGYLAYWRDDASKAAYVFGRLLYKDVDTGHAMLGLESEFGLDLSTFE